MTEKITSFGLYMNGQKIGLAFICPSCSEQNDFIDEDSLDVTCTNCGEEFPLEKQSD